MGVIDVGVGSRGSDKRDDDRLISSSTDERTVDLKPDPEVLEKPERRTFTTAYKINILEETDRCTEPGQIGAILRREGLYFSYLNNWRRQRQEGMLAGLSKRRGRKTIPVNPLAERIELLEKENTRLRRELERASMIIDVQKKVSALLGLSLTMNQESTV